MSQLFVTHFPLFLQSLPISLFLQFFLQHFQHHQNSPLSLSCSHLIKRENLCVTMQTTLEPISLPNHAHSASCIFKIAKPMIHCEGGGEKMESDTIWMEASDAFNKKRAIGNINYCPTLVSYTSFYAANCLANKH